MYVGKIDKSQVLTELCITLTKLVNFINDQIMLSVSQGAKTMSPSFPDAVYGERSIKNSRLFLTIIEHMKVLLELVANKIWGATGKSTLIFFVLILR